MKKNVVFINSHPIQYFAPMYKYMNENGVKTTCWYCSDAAAKGGLDKEFGVNVKWDIPLLDGYEYKFFKNFSWKPSHSKGFFGLMNVGMVRELSKIPKSVVIVHGWHYFTLLSVLIVGKVFGHTVCLRCDVPFSHEVLKTGTLQKIKHFGLKYLLFPRIDYFLYIGEQNRKFYKSYSIHDKKLVACLYAVDNDRFRNEYSRLLKDIPFLKHKRGIKPTQKVVVFSGKYINKKRPMDLLKAFEKVDSQELYLVMIGEGELRAEMEAFITKHNIKNVLLTGFVNQSEISEYYAMGNLFVMCSGRGENWGLSVNEAMNFNLPLVLSDLTGCAGDLVKEGVNGYIFKTGDVEDLATKLKAVLIEDKLTMATSSANIVKKYSYGAIVNNIRWLLS